MFLSLREIERKAALIEIKKKSLYLWHKRSFDEMIDFDRCQMEKVGMENLLSSLLYAFKLTKIKQLIKYIFLSF
jgi:hypothetical protein